VRADRSPNPALYEVKKAYQPVDFKLENNKILLANNHMFTPLSEFELKAELTENGLVAKDTIISIPACSAGTKVVEIANPFVNEELSGEATLIVSLLTLKDMPYAPKGHVTAHEQFVINEQPLTVANIDDECCLHEDAVEIVVTSNSTRVIIDKRTGAIISIDKNGDERLKSPFKPNFYRAIIDNDRLPQVPAFIAKIYMGAGRFKRAIKNLKPISVSTSVVNGEPNVTILWKMPHIKALSTVYKFAGDGIIDAEMSVIAKKDMERYGFTFALREGVSGMEFYGKGPFENYCDRKNSAVLKFHKGNVEDFLHDYLYPQENGNHTEVRRLRLGGEGKGVQILADDWHFEFSAHPYTLDMLEEAKHLHKLGSLDYLTVNIDGRQRGVGGDIPAIAALKPQYKIPADTEHQFSVRMELL
jgi:beta-galactosidase